MLERTLVFVDTSYLLASFYNSWETGARAQLEIDLPEVVNTLGAMIASQLGQKVQRQYWYDGIPESGPHRYQRALRSCDGVQLRTGQLIEWGDRRTQKGVDTRLVADMIVAAMKGQVTDIVLVSGDADMLPGVEETVLNGVRVHLYGFGWDSMAAVLRHACDTTTILDPREDFADAMEIQVLEGPLTPQVREHNADEAASPIEAAVSADGATHADDEAAPAEDNVPGEGAAPAAGNAPGDNAAPTKGAAPSPLPKTIAPGLLSDPALPDGTEPAFIDEDDELDAEDSPAESAAESPAESAPEKPAETEAAAAAPAPKPEPPKPSMMAPRRKLRSRYVPLPEEVWQTAGSQTPFDVGQQYASWWFENAATPEQRDKAHLLSGGGLPPEIDRPLLQFACETLHEYTLTEVQRVNLRDGFHSGIRGVLMNREQ